MPASLMFRDASSRDVFTAIARFADINLVFDPGVPRRAGHRRPAQRHARRRADRRSTASTRTFYRVTGAEDDHHHPRYAGQAPRVRRRGRPHVLSEQRRSQGSRSTCCASCSTRGDLADRPRPTRSRSRTRRSASPRPRASDLGDRQGAARSDHRRRAARSRPHAAARVRAADRLARTPADGIDGIGRT